MKHLFCLLILYCFASAALAESHETTVVRSVLPTSGTLRMVDKLFPPTMSRERWTTAPVDMVMLHFCSGLLATPDKPFDIDWMCQNFTTVTASAHYLIDRDGLVYRLVDEKRAAFHAGKGELPWEPRRTNILNQSSIGIEMFAIGSAHDMKMFGMSQEKYDEYKAAHPKDIGFTDDQYKALNLLLADIMRRNPEIKYDRYHIIGHEEYAPGRRTDPGETFDWSRIGLPRERKPQSGDADTEATTGTLH